MVLNPRPARRILPSLSPNKADRLKRLMTLEVRERLRLIDEITGTVHTWDLTDKGRRELRAKHAEMVALHNQLTKKYESDKAGFYEEVESLDLALPMMVVMGLGSGAMNRACTLYNRRIL